MKVKLIGSCSHCSDLVSYHWSLTRDDGRAVTLDYTTTRTGNSRSNLVLKQGTLEDNHAYTFLLNITSISASEDGTASTHSTSGYSKLTLNPICPPSQGQCSICVVSGQWNNVDSANYVADEYYVPLPCQPVTNNSGSNVIVSLVDVIQVRVTSLS